MNALSNKCRGASRFRHQPFHGQCRGSMGARRTCKLGTGAIAICRCGWICVSRLRRPESCSTHVLPAWFRLEHPRRSWTGLQSMRESGPVGRGASKLDHYSARFLCSRIGFVGNRYAFRSDALSSQFSLWPVPGGAPSTPTGSALVSPKTLSASDPDLASHSSKSRASACA